MTITFPNSSRTVVEDLSRNIIIKANYVPDTEYNNQTVEVCCNHNGGDRDISREELADNAKYGRIIPLLK